MTAYIKMTCNPQLNMLLKACFAISSFCAFCYTVSTALFNISIFTEHRVTLTCTGFISLISMFCFFLSLLCFVILKLYLTFKSSTFQMSLTMIHSFIVIILLIFVVGLSGSILGLFSELLVFGLLLSFSALFLYIFGCSLAVYFFVISILSVAKLQRPSSPNLNESQNEVTLNPRQQKLVELATKSMMLFGIQMGSSILITAVLGWAFPFVLRGPVVSIDVTFNLFCAYCQFGFAAMRYRKCCGYCDDKFRDMMLNRIKRRIFADSLSTGQTQTLESHLQVQSMSIKSSERAVVVRV